MTDKPLQREVDEVLRQMEQQQAKATARVQRLPPLQSMTFTPDEKQRLRTYCAQMTRYRLRKWWRQWLHR